VGLFPTGIVVMLLSELLAVELVEEDGLVKFDDVVDALFPQDTDIKARTIRKLVITKYNLLFTLYPFCVRYLPI
jgi:hypothetical protein